MKNIVFFFIFLAFSLPPGAQAQNSDQGQLRLSLQVKTPKGGALANTEVEFVEVHSRERILAKTDAQGQIQQHFTSGRYWQINIADIRNYFFWQLEVKPKRKMNLAMTLTYDYQRYLRETRLPVDRSKLSLAVDRQQHQLSVKADQTAGVVLLTVSRQDKSPLKNFPVSLTCYALKTTYLAQTNAAGIAVFKVPLGQDYEIDIDGIDSYSYVDLPERPGYRANRGITYEPTEVEEKIRNDTIRQELPPDAQGSSSRVYVNLTLKGGPDGVWRDEKVFMTEVGGKSTYEGRTSQRGEAEFLLPKGKAYMIHGRYERDLDVIDLRRRRGVGYSNKTVLYRPQEKLQFPERFIPTPEYLLLKPFQSFISKTYPLPGNGAAIGPYLSWGGPVNAQSKGAVLKLAFVGAERNDLGNSPPLNIAFVLDKSGSMAGQERMDQLKESMYAFIDRLRPQDVVSLVVFEDFETVIFPAAKLAGNEERLKHAIYMVEADGGTNIYKGLMEGYRQVMKNHRAGATNRVILLTDGYGVTPPEEILKGQTPYTQKGITCSAVGVGESYNFALLRMLATGSGGLIEHVGQSDQLKEVFLRELSNALYPVASNVEVTVQYPNGLSYKQLYGFPLKEKANHRLKFKLKNFYSGMNQVGMLQFKLEKADPALLGEPVTVTVRYKDLRSNTMEEQTLPVPLEWSEAAGQLDLLVAREDRKLLSIAVLNQALKAMADHFSKQEIGPARDVLKKALADILEINAEAKDEDLQALVTEVEGYLEILEGLKSK